MATTTLSVQTGETTTTGYLLHEYFDAEVMDQLLSHPEGYSSKDIRRLSAYKKSRKQGNHVEVVYERGGKVAQQRNLGRLYPRDGLGLQSFPFDIRNPLLEAYYHDIDMVNSHYVLLSTLAERWGLKHTAIETYIQNRDQELAKVSSTREIAKKAFLKVAYGGNLKLVSEFYSEDSLTPEGDLTLLKEIEAELKHIVDYCWRENKDLHRTCSSKPNPKFSCFAYILQTEECRVLLAMMDYFVSRGREVGVFIHDGACVRKAKDEVTFPLALLRGAEAYVRETLGFPIQLLVKPWVHGFKKGEADDKLLPQSTLVDDRYAAQTFVECMGDLFLMDEGKLWVFNSETGMWSFEKTALERVITGLNGRLVFRQMGAMGLKIYDYSGCVEKRNALIKMLPSVAPVRDGVMASRRASDIGKLLFVDGIYDFTTDTFTSGFDPDIMFTARMPRKFPTTRDEEKIAFIRSNTFTAPFGQDGQPTTGDERTLLHELMRAATGDFTRKKAVIGLGPNDCSKGMTMQLTLTAFGSYAKTFNGNSLLHKGFGSESEREMTFVLNFCNARFAFSSEIKVPEGKGTVAVDGTLLKTLASGGDPIESRRLHENASTVVNKAQLFIFANDMPKIAPATTDVQAKIVPVNWSISFVEAPVFANEKKRDAQMSTLYKQPEYGDAYLHILFDEYRAWKAGGCKELVLPETAKVGLEDLMPAKRLGSVLVERYEITRSPLDTVLFEDIKAFVHEQGWEGTDNKLGRELTSLGLGVGRRKDGRRTLVVRSGLKERPEAGY